MFVTRSYGDEMFRKKRRLVEAESKYCTSAIVIWICEPVYEYRTALNMYE